MRSSPFVVFVLTSLVAAAPAAAGASQSPQQQQPPSQSQTRPPASQNPTQGQGTPTQQPPTQQPPAGGTQTGGAPSQTQPGAAQPPLPPPPPAVPASRQFTSDAGMILNVIKPDKTADFEAVMTRVKEALGKSDNPKRKQMALSWRVFKGVEAGPGGNFVYIFWFDPPVKAEDYQITAILGEAFPNELQDLWSKFTQCFVSGQTMLNLQQVVNMSPNATAVPK